MNANILVTGNVMIRGNVAFDSTMLVLGETTVEDANIQGIIDTDSGGDKKELVLMSKGKVLINRLDTFATTQPIPDEVMDAFFYTDSSGELYGVGSMFYLNGGFFAKEDLTVNAVTGVVNKPGTEDTSGKLTFSAQVQDGLKRFVVDYNNEVYGHQQSSLPRVQSIHVHVGPVQLVN
ncbi:hypothetical protein [Paenibacillus donghaensis]|uniref:hypothetical protein n=1 Tax=Paenibacillus donghaensis TaxID=414771 RepID=UPI0012FE3997|nr:hypothetical protein [Paenibacillus donghaensis]